MTPSSDAKAWVLGYLSGMNLVWRAELKLPAEPLAALSSPGEVFFWMDTYCRTNPRRSLGRGGCQAQGGQMIRHGRRSTRRPRLRRNRSAIGAFGRP
jgi:hypothetical protein